MPVDPAPCVVELTVAFPTPLPEIGKLPDDVMNPSPFKDNSVESLLCTIGLKPPPLTVLPFISNMIFLCLLLFGIVITPSTLCVYL